jgi:hypothetical protein
MTHGVCDMRGRGWGKACSLCWTDLSPFLPSLGRSAALPPDEFLHAHTRSQRQSLLRQGRHQASALRRLPLLVLGAAGCLLPRFLSVRQDLDRDMPEPLLRFRHGSERDGRRTGRGSSPVAPWRGSWKPSRARRRRQPRVLPARPPSQGACRVEGLDGRVGCR